MLSTNRIKLDYHLLLVIFAPLLLFWINQNWLFPFGNASDNWIDVSYYFNYGVEPSLYNVYKAVRLSWIIKGWFFHKMFPPLTAYYMLNTIILYACIIPFYYIAKMLFNKPVALLATLAFATYSQFHSINSFEWDYHTHDAMANMVLSMLFLLLATRRPRWKLYLFLAGTTCASAFQSPFLVINGAVLVFWFWSLNRSSATSHPFWASIGMVGLGGLAMSLFYGTFNYFVFHGPFVYFLTEVPGHKGWPGLLGYAYLKSYWQPYGQILRLNKGIVLPLVTLILSIGTLFYLRKKPSDSRNKSPIRLCLYVFLLCLPIPILFQVAGWPALTIYHWEAGLDQFVFLAIAGLFAFFLPELSGAKDKKTQWWMLIGAFVIFCGALVFGYDIQRVFNRVMSSYLVRIVQLLVLASVIALLWKQKQLKRYAGVIVLLSAVVFFPYHLSSHKLLYGSILIAMVYFLWENRRIEPRYVTAIVASLSFLIFPVLSLWRFHIATPNSPFYITLLASAFAFIPIVYLGIYSKPIRRYASVLCLCLLFGTVNVYSTSIPIAFYSWHFKCGYFKDQYVAIMKGEKILRAYDPMNHMYLWFRNNEKVDFPIASCQKKNLAGIYGFPVIGMTALYAAFFGARYKYLYPPEPGHEGMLYKTLASMPNSSYWKQYAPKVVQQNPNRRLYEFLSNNFGGYLSSDSFADFKPEKFWLHVMPKTFKIAIFAHKRKDNNVAVASLGRYGYHLADKHVYYIKEGVVSYYIVMGVATKDNIHVDS